MVICEGIDRWRVIRGGFNFIVLGCEFGLDLERVKDGREVGFITEWGELFICFLRRSFCFYCCFRCKECCYEGWV